MSNPDNSGPPVAYRFKPGESGNPNGRPRGSRNKKNRPPRMRQNPMDEKIDFVINGKVVRITRTEALVRSAADRALKTKDGRLESLLADLNEELTLLEAKVDYNDWLRVRVWTPNYSWDYPEGVLIGMGMARALDQKRLKARVVLEPWVVELALARMAPGSLTYEQQKLVVAATRLAHKVKWPAWWDRRLRKRPRGSHELLLAEELRWNGGKRI